MDIRDMDIQIENNNECISKRKIKKPYRIILIVLIVIAVIVAVLIIFWFAFLSDYLQELWGKVAVVDPGPPRP